MIQSAQLLRNRLSSGIERNEKTARQTGLDLSLVEAYARERGIFTLLENIQTAGQGAADIVSNMLSFARKPDHKKQGCRLETIVDKALALLHNDLGLQYGFNTIKVSKSYDPGLPEICCEETKIRQVLFNLLKNAAQALNAPGDVNDSPAIDIGIHTETDNICLRIKDNGPGMDEAVRKRIFEPFLPPNRWAQEPVWDYPSVILSSQRTTAGNWTLFLSRAKELNLLSACLWIEFVSGCRISWYQACLGFLSRGDLQTQGFRQGEDPVFDFISDLSVGVEDLFRVCFSLCQFGRIIKSMVDNPGCARKPGAGFMGMAAQGDHGIKGPAFEFVNML